MHKTKNFKELLKEVFGESFKYHKLLELAVIYQFLCVAIPFFESKFNNATAETAEFFTVMLCVLFIVFYIASVISAIFLNGIKAACAVLAVCVVSALAIYISASISILAFLIVGFLLTILLPKVFPLINKLHTRRDK